MLHEMTRYEFSVHANGQVSRRKARNRVISAVPVVVAHHLFLTHSAVQTPDPVRRRLEGLTFAARIPFSERILFADNGMCVVE